MSKMTWLVVGGVGFLLGSRAGRGPYEKVSTTLRSLAEDPRVRQRAEEAKAAVVDKTTEVVDKVTRSDATDPGVTRLHSEMP